MGAVCGGLTGSIPNLYLICLQAVEHELIRRESWLTMKLEEMSKRKEEAIKKAKGYISERKLLLALTAGKAALMEQTKIQALEPTQRALKEEMNKLKAEITKEENSKMDLQRLKEQLNKTPIKELKELVEKWVKKFEDMLQNASTPLDLIAELESYSHMNPLELFKKIKELGSLDIDEGAIFLAFNPQLIALKSAKSLLLEKKEWVIAQEESLKKERDSVIANAKIAAGKKEYINALLLVKSAPIYEGKILAAGPFRKGLEEEINMISLEIDAIEKAKPNIEELEKMLSQNPEAIVSAVIGKWLKKQEELATKLIPSAEETMNILKSSISLNPIEIVNEIKKSGLIEISIDLLPLPPGVPKEAIQTATKLVNAASSAVGVSDVAGSINKIKGFF